MTPHDKIRLKTIADTITNLKQQIDELVLRNSMPTPPKKRKRSEDAKNEYLQKFFSGKMQRK